MEKEIKEVILLEDLIRAIDNLPNCKNGYSGTYDKSHILHVVKCIPTRHVVLDTAKH